MNSTEIAQQPSVNNKERDFFGQSIFRSARFLTLTFFSAAFVLAEVIVMIRYRAMISSLGVVSMLGFAYQGAFGGVFKVVKAHERIWEEYQIGRIPMGRLEAPLSVALDIAQNALIYSAFNNLILMSGLLWMYVYVIQHRG